MLFSSFEYKGSVRCPKPATMTSQYNNLCQSLLLLGYLEFQRGSRISIRIRANILCAYQSHVSYVLQVGRVVEVMPC